MGICQRDMRKNGMIKKSSENKKSMYLANRISRVWVRKIKKEILYSYSIFFKRPTGIAKISFKRTGMGTETGNKMPGMV
jgi:hypothetical protein